MQPSCYLHKGCQLAHEVRGTGPPVVLIQGLGIHGRAWKPQVDALAADYRCLTFDNRGIGRSQPRGCAITIPQMAEDALALMDAQGWEAAHVVGQSMGGLIAIEMALRAGRRVRSLALICSLGRGSAVFPRSPGMIWQWLRTQVGTKSQKRGALLELIMPESALGDAYRAALA